MRSDRYRRRSLAVLSKIAVERHVAKQEWLQIEGSLRQVRDGPLREARRPLWQRLARAKKDAQREGVHLGVWRKLLTAAQHMRWQEKAVERILYIIALACNL